MRSDYTSVGAEFTATEGQKAALTAVIDRLKWQSAKGLTLGFMQGAAIKEAIKQFKIPKVTHVAIGAGESIRPAGQGPEEWHAAVYGIEGHYTNGTVQLFLLDRGDACIPLVAQVYPLAEAQPVHRVAKPEAPSSDAVTIYLRGEFFGNIVKIEAKACTVEFKRYAQHERAAHVTFVPRGKRSARVTFFYENHVGLIVGGWGRPDPEAMLVDEKPTPSDEASGLITQRGRYMSGDPRWQSNFDEMIDPLLASGEIPVVFDFRKGVTLPSPKGEETPATL